MYTHLHNDHAGGMLLFPNSQHLFQRDEYYNMLHPLPTQKIRRDYDPRTPGDLAQIKNVRMIDGDFDMGNGIRLFKVPGHSLGGMAIQVQTAEGKYVITGDMPHIAQSLFPQMDKMEVIGGEIVDAPPKEIELLYFLASSPNRVFTRAQLLDDVWGFDYFGDTRTVDVHVKRLREKLEGVSDKWELKTVWGVGYKFETKE